MALKDLVTYVSRRCASMPNRCNLYEMADKHDWNADDVLAFVQYRRIEP